MQERSHNQVIQIEIHDILYRNRRNFRLGLIFCEFWTQLTKNAKIILHMCIACHKKLYCTGQNDEVKFRWKFKILEKSGNVRN